MKDLINKDQKAAHAINLLFVILIISFGKTISVQSQTSDGLSSLEYQVINSIIPDGVIDSVFIYNKTYYDKG